jgi:hypothetical protein
VEFSRRNENQGVHVEFSVRRPSPPNTYSYVREENSGSTRKFEENHLTFMCITNKTLALCTIHVQNVFLDSKRKFVLN